MSRSSSSQDTRQADDQYQRWQDAKARYREEEHSLLKQKLVLQHKLIDAVDARTSQRQQELLQKQEQERDDRRKERKGRNDALVRNTLKKASVARTKPARDGSPENLTEYHDGSDDPGPIPMGRPLSAIPSSETNGSLPSSPTRSAAGDAPDIRQDHRSSSPFDYKSFEGWEKLPRHEQELHRMFGAEQAENYLHPKDLSARKENVHVPDDMRVLGGRAGADRLWSLLRDRTLTKMSLVDAGIPADLRKSYSAHIREYLAQTKPEERRKFFKETDLPLSERVEDSHHHENVREIRRSMELMYRSSQTNKDKTDILLHHNPMPDFNDLNGIAGVQRYQPSWMEDQDEPVLSDDRTHKDEPHAPTRDLEKSDTPSPDIAGDQRSRRPRSHRGQRLSFLTEEEATVPGQFWKNHRNPEEETTIPGNVIMEYVAAQKRPSETRDGEPSKEYDLAGPPPKSGSKYQTLTLSALGDHRPLVDVQGEGDFKFGRPATWKPVVANNLPAT